MFNVKRIVNSFFNSNTFVLYRERCEQCYLIDPGNTDDILTWMKINSITGVKGIFVTHSHFDHINAINDLLLHFKHTPVYVSKNEGLNIISDDKKNASRYNETPYVVDKDHCVEVSEGDTFQLWGNEEFKVYETPGHSPDSVSFVCGKYIFTGDAFIPSVKVITKLRGGNKELAKKSLNLIFSLINENSIICPGHEEVVSYNKLELNYEYL